MEISSEINQIKAAVASEKAAKQIEQQIKELKCSHCQRWIVVGEDAHYYFCTLHHNVFCDRCAKNDYKMELNVNKAVHCKGWKIDALQGNDCFYEKRFINAQEV